MQNKKKCKLREAQLIMLEILKDVHKVCEENKIKYFIIDGTLLGAVRHKGFIPWDDDLDIAMLRKDYEKFLKVAPKKLKSDLFVQTIKSDKNYTLYHIPTKVRKNNTLFIEFGEDNPKYHSGIYIDVFPYDDVCNSKVKEFIRQDILSFLLKCKYKGNGKGMKAIIRRILNILTKPISYEYLDKCAVDTVKWTENSTKGIINYGVELIWNKEFKKEEIFPLKKIEFEGMEFYCPNNPHKVLENIYGDYMELPPEEERTWHAKDIYVIEK